MFLYNSAPKNKSLKTGKVAPELIEHFKNTAEIPKRSHKENQNPKQFLNTHPDIKIEHKNDGGLKNADFDKSIKMTKSKIVEQDISKIAQSYVLEGNFLKKHQAYQAALKKDKNKETTVNKQNIYQAKPYDRKQLLKLEYLQKMGFLRPDQKQTLAEFRKMSQQAPKQPTHEVPEIIVSPPPRQTQPKAYQNTEMYNYLPFYSPKGLDAKKLSQLPHYMTPNSKYILPNHMNMTTY